MIVVLSVARLIFSESEFLRYPEVSEGILHVNPKWRTWRRMSSGFSVSHRQDIRISGFLVETGDTAIADEESPRRVSIDPAVKTDE
jgi:hypothetical protein